MRRSRETAASASSDPNVVGWQPSGFDLYGIQGDSMAALTVFQQQFEGDDDEDDVENETKDGVERLSKAAQYNCALLSYLVTTPTNQITDTSSSPTEQLLHDLVRMESEITASTTEGLEMVLPPATHKSKRNQLILAYNRALVLQSMGRLIECAAICVEHLEPFLFTISGHHPNSSMDDDQVSMVVCRLGLLLLECILTLAVGKAGLEYAVQKLSTDQHQVPSANKIFEWLENDHAALLERDAPLKFLLQIFKSRAALADLDHSGKVSDTNVRSARKDMKIAMEIFQHKLRPSFGADTVSVVSSANSEELSSTGNHHNNNNKSAEQHQQQQQPPPPSSVVLQKLNQSALCLKAHLEQLKGNTKKSLILCAEAVAATTNNHNNNRHDKGGYEALHNNNLAVVYETNNRRHLALHALTKALRATTHSNDDPSSSSSSSPLLLFHRDGTARTDPTRAILGNAAVCALRARKFVAAYECAAAMLHGANSGDTTNAPLHPRGWLRLAEACLGIFADLRQRSSAHKFSLVEVDA